MPLGFPVEGLESGLRYRHAPGDRFVATYPKCGTTWTQYIVYLLVRRRAILPDEALTALFPHLEEVGADAVCALEEPRLIKTHLPASMLTTSDGARYVVVARNPFDCAVSFYYHTVGFPRHYQFSGGSFDDFFECFVAGEVDFGDYFDHLRSWRALSGRPNVLFLTYEQMRSDTRAAVRDIARFLGSTAGEDAHTDAVVDWVAAESSIVSMRQSQARWSSPRPRDLPFVREGSVGGWATLFSRDQVRALLARVDREPDLHIADLWPTVIADARRAASR